MKLVYSCQGSTAVRAASLDRNLSSKPKVNQLLRAITKHTHAHMSKKNVRVRRARQSRIASTSITTSQTNVRYEMTFQNIAPIAYNEIKMSCDERGRVS